jgi:hypothetical protein
VRGPALPHPLLGHRDAALCHSRDQRSTRLFQKGTSSMYCTVRSVLSELFMTRVSCSIMIRLLAPPRQQLFSLSRSPVCRRSSLLTVEGERSQIMRPRESLAFFKSVNTLWYFTIEIFMNFLSFLVKLKTLLHFN